MRPLPKSARANRWISSEKRASYDFLNSPLASRTGRSYCLIRRRRTGPRRRQKDETTMTSTTTEICFYDGCTSLATEHDRVGDLACPLHAAQSEKYVVVEDFDGSWLDEASAARAESILVAAGWMVTIRRPRRGEIEATYEVRPAAISRSSAARSRSRSRWTRRFARPRRRRDSGHDPRRRGRRGGATSDRPRPRGVPDGDGRGAEPRHYPAGAAAGGTTRGRRMARAARWGASARVARHRLDSLAR